MFVHFLTNTLYFFTLEVDIDLDSNQSDEEEPVSQRTTACRPLIHRKEDEYNSSDSCSEDEESGHPAPEGNYSILWLYCFFVCMVA